jgi:ABC-type branched-subunit amino acid transport system permease subunit
MPRAADLVSLASLGVFIVLAFAAPRFLLLDLSIYFTYAILAASLAFAWGHCGLLVLGHAVSFGIGAYAMSIVTLGMLPGLPDLRSSWLGFLAAILLPGLVSLLLGLFFFGGRGLKGPFFGIVSLALAVLAELLAINAGWLGGNNGLMNVPPITLGINGGGVEIHDALPLYLIMLGALCGVIIMLRLVMASRFGLSLAALRENELRAQTLGHDVAKLKTLAFALAGMAAGLAGALFVVQFGFASPSLIGFSLSAEALIWTALGGRGYPIAAALGAILIRWLDAQFSGGLGAVWPLILGLAFMLSVILLPRGFFGEMIARLDMILGRIGGGRIDNGA